MCVLCRCSCVRILGGGEETAMEYRDTALCWGREGVVGVVCWCIWERTVDGRDYLFWTGKCVICKEWYG